MQITVISASPREGSQSLRVANYLLGRVKQLGADSAIVDLHEVKLPMYDDSDAVKNSDGWASISTNILEADGYIVVVPEWNGMAPPIYKNMLMYVGQAMAHKPYMVCGVSAGRGGVHVLDELRATGQKNTHLVMSPENLIASYVESLALDDSFNEDSEDHWFKVRADYAIKVLIAYAEALRNVRNSEVIDFERFPSGL